MNSLNKILDLMERIDENYHQYATLINEDKRGKAAKNACYNVFRQYFNNASFLDQEFVHQDNPEHLSAIDYMYKQFMDEFYHDPATRAGAVMRLAPMFLRLALESGFQQGRDDANKLNRLRNILNYIHQSNKTKGIDLSQIDINTTFEELNDAFGKEIDNQNASMKDRINNGVYDENNNFNGYKIVGPLTFEEANKYGNESCPDSKLCYTQENSTWNRYSANDINNVYVLLRDGWENVPPEHDDENDSAYDTYGLSMIFVFVDGQGDLAYCNTRWNHSANYKSGSSCDHALNEEEISQLIGRNFYSVFKPNNKWNELVEDSMTRLKNGENPDTIFDGFFPDIDNNGVAQVILKDRYNLIDMDNYKLLFNPWFEYIGSWTMASEHISYAELHHKFTYITSDGRILSPGLWVDNIGYFWDGLGRVYLNGKANFVKSDGNLLSNEWFDAISNFEDGIAIVYSDSKQNYLNINGKLLSDLWFDSCEPFGDDGVAKVKYKNRSNIINRNGELLSDEWFDYVDDIYKNDKFIRVMDNSGYNFIDKNGKLLSDTWFNYASRFDFGFAKVRLGSKELFINPQGELFDQFENLIKA